MANINSDANYSAGSYSNNELFNSSIPQPCLEVDSVSYTNATGHERGGNVFTFDSVAQTVTFKRAVPVGKNVVMPNIIFYTSSNFSRWPSHTHQV